MYQIIRTHSKNPDFVALVKKLDQYLAIVDGDDHDFYNQYNGLEALNNVVICYLNDEAAGCGAFKPYDDQSVEIKRMFVDPKSRGNGIGGKVLKELEKWAAEMNFSKTILETGKRQFEAVNLYKKHQYVQIPNYGQYKTMENSVCFEKVI